MKKSLILLIFLILLTGCQKTELIEIEKSDDLVDPVQTVNTSETIDSETADETANLDDLVNSEPKETESEKLTDEETNKSEQTNTVQLEIPTKFDLKPAFASQAPHGNWELPYQEACEEAALITAVKYYKNEPLDADIMDKSIQDLVTWQLENIGFYTDTGVSEVVDMAVEYYNLEVEVIDKVTVNNIKYYLNQGYLILVPTAGRELGNPYYSGAGPVYHFLVIRGYDNDEFITNDVGTKRGDGYKYDYDVLINAIYDLPKDENGDYIRLYESEMEESEQADLILTGLRKMIIIK